MIDEFWTDELAEEIIALAEEAGEAVDAVYRRVGEVDTEYKDDESPVTEADIASHELLVEGLRERTPEVPILSEESDDIDYEERREWERFWLIDPLDGTKEFLKRNGEFTVNVALIEDGEPTAGVVHAPALERTYWAADGQGAYRRSATGDERRIEAADRIDGPPTVVVSRSHINDETQDFVDRLSDQYGEVDLLPVGSSLKLCMVAEGEAHVYPRLAPTMEWDTGAAHCVASEAGARVTTVDGDPLTYNKRDLHNPHFIVDCTEAVR